MKEVEFEELSWPKGLGLDILEPLKQFVPEEVFKEFIVGFSRDPRKARRIILPSKQTIRKVFFHYLWRLIEEGEASWDEIKEGFKNDFKTLKSLNITKYEARRLYRQRKKEIKMEIESALLFQSDLSKCFKSIFFLYKCQPERHENEGGWGHSLASLTKIRDA